MEVKLGLVEENVLTPAERKAGEVLEAAICPYGLLSPNGLQGAGRGKNQISY